MNVILLIRSQYLGGVGYETEVGLFESLLLILSLEVVSKSFAFFA